ncbi:MAG: amino acid adenylation domain-containing protein, partial [Elusimicrobia bacterium]|nr:amino acid adenylation domain-containing protein [Elusimicrobiota bacterium]
YYAAKAGAGEASGEELRGFLARALPEHMLPQLFVRLPALPLTEHGKLDRQALPVPGRLERVAGAEYAAPRTEAERVLAEVWQEVLKLDRVGVRDDFFALGGDSILSIQVIAKARSRGLRLSPKQLFLSPTISGLAAAAASLPAADSRRGAARPEGAAPLTPIQRWFFAQELERPGHFNQAFILHPSRPLDLPALRLALETVARQHDALRLRFRCRGARGWEQRYAARADAPDLRQALVARERDLAEACRREQARFDIAKGPVFAACVLRGPQDRERLLLAAHHLVVDGVSWRIILEDLELAYRQAEAGEPIRLPSPSDPFQAWGRRLMSYARDGAAAGQWDYWLSVRAAGPSVPVDFRRGEPVFGESLVSRIALGPADTEQLLTRGVAGWGVNAEDVLLAALLLALRRLWTVAGLLLHLEGHGREEIGPEGDVSRTVGWFTSLYPVCLRLPRGQDPGELVRCVKDQLRKVPDRGLGYGALRYLSGDPRSGRLAEQDTAAVCFNYLGKVDSFGGLDRALAARLEPAPGLCAPENRRPHLVDCWAWVSGGGLEVELALSARHFAPRTAARLRRLYREALAEFLAAGRGAGEVEARYGLAPLQKGLLFHSRYAPRSDQYVEQVIWRCREALDCGALKAAWKELVQRHAVLRTAFVWDERGEPAQVVCSEAEAGWREQDWRGLSADALERRWEEHVAADRTRGFVFARPGLNRLFLARTGEREYRCLWTHHHLLLDGWSLALLADELEELYAARRAGRPARLPLPSPFAEYVRWAAARDKAEALDFWRRRMAGVEGPTPLAFCRTGARLDVREPAASLGEHVRVFSAARTERCLRFVREQRVTLNSLLQLAWALVLCRFSGRDEVVMGMTISGRAAPVAGVERMVGLLINTVPLPFALEAGASAASQLRRLHGMVQEVNEHGFLSLTEIQGCGAVPFGTPLFYSLFVFENHPLASRPQARLVRDVEFREKTNYPLTAVVVPGERLSVKMSFDAQVFTPESVARLAAGLENAVEWILAHPGEPLDEAEIMTGPERALVLGRWTRGQALRPGLRTVAELFAAAVQAHGPEPALSFRGRSLTYSELDRCSDAFAARLAPETIVGLYARRSVETVAAVLGALKAGAAYLPLDPEHPDARTRLLAEDARLAAVLAQEPWPGRLAGALAGTGVRILGLEEAGAGGRAPGRRPGRGPGPGSLAYVIYTSGSTGTPKGVAVEHRSAAELIAWMKREYPLGPGDAALQLTALTFDVSVAEMLWPLCSGARLVLAEPGAAKDPAGVLRTIRAERVTAVGFVPSFMSVLLDAAEAAGPQSLRSLRYAHAAGEALPVELARRFLRLCPARLDNIYGPTEAAVYSSFHRCSGEEGLPVVPIGRPAARARLYVLDQDLRPVPPGVPGQLCIGGAGLARGYLHRPELTAERFVPDPFARGGEEPRLYKTGDRARWLEDGEIEYLGREDLQLKVRGFRVEPGEVEAALARHPAVGRCVVVARGQGEGRTLAAYYTRQASAPPPSSEDLRAFLARSLPDPMLPSVFMPLDRLPTGPSGKLDRGALPEADAAPTRRGGRAAPRDELETALAGIFQEVLGRDRLSAEDDFFRLGGHSLLAARLMTRINRELRTDLPVSAVFARPTVRRLAELLRQAPSASGGGISAEDF